MLRKIIYFSVYLVVLIVCLIVGLEIYLSTGGRGISTDGDFEKYKIVQEMPWLRREIHQKSGPVHKGGPYVLDYAVGFIPNMNDQWGYSEYGTKTNSYAIEKKKGKQRILFLGDSITARGKIVSQLKQLYRTERYEYWNAGVEGYNTFQEVEFYKKYNHHINPDHVILTFTIPNDFEDTPVIFIDDASTTKMYSLNTSIPVNLWIFRKSATYRFAIVAFSRFSQPKGSDSDSSAYKLTNESIRQLKTILEKENIRLSVILSPYLIPPKDWSYEQNKKRETILEILNTQGIQYFDLYDKLHDAMTANKDMQSSPRDIVHPDEQFSKITAAYLFDNGLLSYQD